MNGVNISPKIVLLGMGTFFAADLMGCFGFAAAMHYNVVPVDAAELLAVLALVIASAASGVISATKSGNHGTGYAAGALCLLLLTLCGYIVCGNQWDVSHLIRSAVAIFTGMFIGNFFGELKHNRLRKNRKNARLYTK